MHPLLEHNQATLLGRLKNYSISKLTGSWERLPSDREYFREVFRRWKTNPENGRFYHALLNTTHIHQASFPSRVGRKSVRAVLQELQRGEYFDNVYVEGPAIGETPPTQFGCLILGHRRPNGEPGYYAKIYDGSDLDHCLFCSVVPAGVEGLGRIDILTTSGWREVSCRGVARITPLRVLFASFRALLDESALHYVPPPQMHADPATTPPDDPELMRRLKSIARSEMPVTRGLVSMASILPHSLDFCLTIRPELFSSLAIRIGRGYRPFMAVYWNGTGFVMSDDYPDYLAYKRAKCTEVPVAILGEFPDGTAVAEQVGGWELLPPCGIARYPVAAAPRTSEFKKWQLEERLRGTNHKERPADLIVTFLLFAEQLHDEDADERQLHRYIQLHPVVLSAYGTRIESEVWLAQQYRIDLILRSTGVCEEVMLVELENHRHTLFTRSGQPRAEITHAIQQVQDWFRWLRENPTDLIAVSLGGIPPRGLVVAGRSRDFTDEDRSRLAHLNTSSAVPVITYDELLDRFGDLVLSQLADDQG